MSRRIYHVLPEAETFSDLSGGAIARWVANVTRADSSAQIVAARADHTWTLNRQQPGTASAPGEELAQRLHLLPGYARYHRLPAALRYRLPLAAHHALLRACFTPLSLRAGDTLWIHNRPRLASALAPALRQQGIRIVLHLHNSHLVTHRGPVDADALVFCSEFLRNQGLHRIPAHLPAAVLANGADERLFAPPGRPSHHPNLTILFVGRLVPEKGAHLLVAAMRQPALRALKITAHILGRPAFHTEASSAYLADLRTSSPPSVRFLGYRTGTALAQAYRDADIFCAPACWQEPFGMVNVEAMASRLPTVATAVGGVPEIFREGGALLLPPADPQALATALASLATDPARRTALAHQAYASFRKNYRWSVIRDRYRQLVEELLP